MHLSRSILTVLVLSVLIAACEEGPPESDSQSAAKGPVINVTAIYDADSNRHLFATDADTVDAGWTTFKFTNASPMLHFALLDHLPGERTSEELLSEVSPIFQQSADLVREGKPEEAAALFTQLPEWFNGIVFRGGAGFLSPGHSSETTVYLEPGNYVLECYIKTPEGVFHWNLGMYADLHVTENVTDAQPPADPTFTVTVTDSALIMDGEATPGENLVEVDFQEENPGLFGKDVHVARLDEGTSVEEIVRWMDANRVEGLVSTAEDPAPALFLGGVHDMPYGSSAFFTLNLEPGEYLLIAEQPVDQSVHHRFRVQ
jgi:hypothetical protein